MSRREVDRLKVIERVLDRRLSQTEAAEQLGVSARQMRRLVKANVTDETEALVSRKRGKRSNNAYSNGFKDLVIGLVTAHYADFGPTLAAEKLLECHEITVSRETLRG